MKRNPLLPFALIAFVGIILMVVLSYQGLNKASELAKQKSGGSTSTQVANKPEDIVKNVCSTCHGGNLEGGVGPKLATIGSELSADQIKTILLNGKGNMPAGLVSAQDAEAMSKWLAAKK